MNGAKDMNRRGFLGAILAAAAAPAIIKAEALMPVRKIVVPGPVAIWKPKPYITEADLVAPHHGFRLGDVVTIAGVVSATGALQKFRVTSTASGVLTVQAG